MAFLPQTLVWHRRHTSSRGENNVNNITTICNKLEKIKNQDGIIPNGSCHKSWLDVTTINELESGKRQPMLKTTWKIANALNV